MNNEQLFCETDHLLHDNIEWYISTCLWVAEQYLSGNTDERVAKRSLGHIGIDPGRLSFWCERYREDYPTTWFLANGEDTQL